MEYCMDNAFIRKIYIRKDNRKVIFGTNNRVSINGKYKDIAYSVNAEKIYIDITDEKILVDCEVIFNSLLVLRNERINVIVSKDEGAGNNSDLILEGIELSNE